MTVQNYKEQTCIAPVNIAVVKYWGKRDTELILPTNSSLSVTLDTNDLHSRTTIRCSPDFQSDEFWLNGQQTPMNKRMLTCLGQLRNRRSQLESNGVVSERLAHMRLRIASVNNFPTAAGLASSASGFACLVYTLARLYELIDERAPIDAFQQLSMIARQGSGSACRSLMGGYVKWEMGQSADGSDSRAVQVAPRQHWPEMRALILVASDAKKAVSSTSGMQTTCETSALFSQRIQHVVPDRMALMERAIRERDFPLFAELTMKDSNQFHAVCLDTFPPIFYLNDTSKTVIRLVEQFNQRVAGGRLAVAYTFDAGPNAVLYCLESDLEALVRFIFAHFAGGEQLPPVSQELHQIIQQSGSGGSEQQSAAGVEGIQLNTQMIKRIILSRVGDGPKDAPNQSLFDTAEGNVVVG